MIFIHDYAWHHGFPSVIIQAIVFYSLSFMASWFFYPLSSMESLFLSLIIHSIMTSHPLSSMTSMFSIH